MGDLGDEILVSILKGFIKIGLVIIVCIAIIGAGVYFILF